jgi:hypothetical protein
MIEIVDPRGYPLRDDRRLPATFKLHDLAHSRARVPSRPHDCTKVVDSWVGIGYLVVGDPLDAPIVIHKQLSSCRTEEAGAEGDLAAVVHRGPADLILDFHHVHDLEPLRRVSTGRSRESQ